MQARLHHVEAIDTADQRGTPEEIRNSTATAGGLPGQPANTWAFAPPRPNPGWAKAEEEFPCGAHASGRDVVYIGITNSSMLIGSQSEETMRKVGVAPRKDAVSLNVEGGPMV